MNDLPTPQPATKPTKQLFYNICLMYDFDDQALQQIADMAKVHKSIVDSMFVSVAVRREDAEKVLVAFGDATDRTWSFENLKVALLPTFKDLHYIHNFDLAYLSTSTGVPFAVLDMMLSGNAVTPQDARLVLQMVSRIVSEHYTLETVDIPLLETGGNTNAAAAD